MESLFANEPPWPSWPAADPAVRAFALFSDVHCNLSALRAGLADLSGLERAQGRSYTIAFLGDVVDTGPSPAATLDLAVSLSSVHVRGNHEVYLSECLRGLHRNKYASPHWRYVPWTLAQLGKNQYQSYEGLLRDEWQTCDGRVRLVHGSAESCHKAPAFFHYDAVGWSHEVTWFGSFRRATLSGHTLLVPFTSVPMARCG